MSTQHIAYALCIQSKRQKKWHFIKSEAALVGYRLAQENMTPFDATNKADCRKFTYRFRDVRVRFRLVHVVVIGNDRREHSEVRAFLCKRNGTPKETFLRRVELISMPESESDTIKHWC